MSSSARASEEIRVPAPASVEAYLAELPPEFRAALESLRAVILAAAPGATDTISYSMPALRHRGRILVSNAAFKDHCSLFPCSMAVIESLEAELAPFRASKGTLHFRPDRPIPAEVVTRIVEARVVENEARGPRR
jgi:uncharacterized protein YdhG (YjbR/CyaY superfamily)